MGLRKITLVCVLLAFGVPGLATAAITVNEPDGLGNETVAEGIEFSAYVKGNRWDMSDPTFEYHWHAHQFQSPGAGLLFRR